MDRATSVNGALREARERLAAAGVSSPDLDASLLLAEVLGLRRERLALMPHHPLDGDEAARFRGLVSERAKRVPMAQILGSAEFWSLEFKVTADTLSPRPETEMLVEEAVKVLRGIERPVVVDIGTGTGCIAVAIAKEVPLATVHAVDLSPAALAVARENVRRHGVEDRVHLHEGDLFAPLTGVLAPGSVDVVVSNPPYVRRDEEFDPEILFEPAMALFVDDVPGVYRRIAEGAARFVKAGGALFCELPGAHSDEAIDAIRTSHGWMRVGSRRDLAGHERVVVAVRVQSDGEHSVAVVVDPDYGERVNALSQTVHVWLVESPANTAAAERIWREHAREHSLDHGITTFRGRPECARDELVCEILETIDDHHGEWSHDPPWSVLEVHGTAATAPLRAALAALGFTEVEPTAEGFRAARPAPRVE